MLLPVNIIFHINTYLSNHFLLDNDYKKHIEKEKEHFEKQPQLIRYRLMRYRGTSHNSKYLYPQSNNSMIKIGEVKDIYLDGNISLKDCSLNKTNNKIIPSDKLKEIIVPESSNFVYPYYMWGLYPSIYITVRWDIYDMEFTDYEKIVLYKLLF